ncbi:MAG: MFS transporter [bacterium]
MKSDPALDRRTVFSWCMYDFANSPFTTLVVTFIYAAYFTDYHVENSMVGTVLWSRAVTVAAITVALLSPIMGTIADRGTYRKLFLFITTCVCVIGSILLYGAEPGQTMKALFWFVIANIAFEMGAVFYNAFLPDIAPLEKIGRVSGYGWSIGYVGGLAAMVIALVGFVYPETPWFGFSKEAYQNVRATNLLVAAWFAIFSIPTFLWVKEKKTKLAASEENIFKASYKQLAQTFTEIRQYRQIVRLLVARLIYNDGLVTIFAFGGIYAAGTFNFTIEEIIVFGIVLNVGAGIGAFSFGFLDDILGGKKTIMISLVGLTLAAIIAVLAPSREWFWVAGVIIGLLSGPNQAASRSLMGRFVPRNMEAEVFGFFAFSGKATAFLGPLLLGILTGAFGSQRVGVSIVIVFFVIGGVLLHFVDEEEGVRLSGRKGVVAE